MKHNVKILEPEELAESLPQLLEEAEAVPLVISGSSMTPFLVHGRDTVYLSGVKEPLKRGDIAFYRRENGRCILHRVYRVEGACYTMVGDAQTELEPGIRPDQVIAVVKCAKRKGKMQSPGCFWWAFFEKIWIRMVPLRPLVRSVYEAFRRIWKR
jgi:hypothetical protein